MDPFLVYIGTNYLNYSLPIAGNEVDTTIKFLCEVKPRVEQI